MSKVEKSIDVNVPVRTAYNQWTQFEEFPRFMEGVREVRQLDDKRLLWRAEIGGVEKSWEAEITEQVPDMRIAWRSRTGTPNAGVVTFHRLSDGQTRIMLQMDTTPRGSSRMSATRSARRACVSAATSSASSSSSSHAAVRPARGVARSIRGTSADDVSPRPALDGAVAGDQPRMRNGADPR